jgi:hypothetical protein
MNQDFNPLKSKQLFAHRPKGCSKSLLGMSTFHLSCFWWSCKARVLSWSWERITVFLTALSARLSRKPRLEPAVMPLMPGLVMRIPGLTAVTLKAHHKQYESFSQLLCMTFDEALQQVADESVDLLHIDGLHTYEAVKRDYNATLSWTEIEQANLTAEH